jgi:hypothetical protein
MTRAGEGGGQAAGGGKSGWEKEKVKLDLAGVGVGVWAHFG